MSDKLPPLPTPQQWADELMSGRRRRATGVLRRWKRKGQPTSECCLGVYQSMAGKKDGRRYRVRGNGGDLDKLTRPEWMSRDQMVALQNRNDYPGHEPKPGYWSHPDDAPEGVLAYMQEQWDVKITTRRGLHQRWRNAIKRGER